MTVPRLLTIPEVAELLGYKDVSAVYALISSQKLPTVDGRASGKQSKTRIREDHLVKFIEARTTYPPGWQQVAS